MNPVALILELRFVDYPTSGSHARGFGTDLPVEGCGGRPGSAGAGRAYVSRSGSRLISVPEIDRLVLRAEEALSDSGTRFES